MSTTHALYHLMLADFLERVRRYSFLIVLTATVLIGYSMLPAVDDSYNAFVIGIYRPFYNSAGVGTAFGMVIASMVTLFGFFLVRNAVPRDYQTKVGQIIATTPISKQVYMLGKWFSNLAVLSSILVVLTLVALVMQLVRAEDLHINLWALAAPIWFMGLPPLALVAAISVLFECVPVPSGLGNILFSLMWFFSIAFLISPAIVGQKTSTLDIYGMSHVMADLRAEMISQGLDPDQGDTDLYQPTGGRETKRFSWDGASWDVVTILKRLLWVVLAGLIALVAAIPFDRFDPATWEVEVRKKKKKRKDNVEPVAQNNEGLIASLDDPEQEFLAEGERLSALSKGRSHSRLWTTIVSEFYLMVKGRSLWWYASTAGLAIACIFSTDKIFNLLITPLSWLWPVFVWSGMGNQEIKNRTNHIVFPVAHLIKRQLLPHWVAGCILAVLATVVVALRLTMGGEWGLLLGWSVGCIFIPALALMLGVWTNGGRTFEMVYFVLWALGVKYPTVIFNFMGRSPEPGAQLVPLFYIAVTVILLMLAAVGRKKQIVSLLR